MFRKPAAAPASKKDKKKGKKGAADSDDELAEGLKSVSLAGQTTSTSYGPGLTRALGRGVEGEVRADGSFAASTDYLTVTGTSVSDETSKDIMIDQFSMAAYGQTMVKDTTLKLIYGRRYGLIGPNGCGKSTLLRMLARREVPIQNSIDIYLLENEFAPTDMTAIEAVVDIVKTEKEALENEQEELLGQPNGHEDPRFEAITERINDLDIETAERRAKEVLAGLGFTPQMQLMTTKEFSGGWRMRISLARALFVKPTLLLLDEPTNHLDLGACVWLEEYMKKYKHTILFVSHSQDFLNGICTDIMHMHNRKLDYYTGDYDGFVHARGEKDEYLKKRAKAEEKQVKKMQDTVAKLGQKVAKQAKQKEKAMQKKSEKIADLKDELVVEKDLKIRFNDCGRGIPPPVLQFRDVSFGYPGRDVLFKNVTLGFDLDSRVALVGPNGAGKSTLLKLMVGQVQPTTGEVKKHHHLRIARFHQHLTDQLDLQATPVGFLVNAFRDEEGTAIYKDQDMRNILGRFGLTGKSQVQQMFQLSDGQRRRVIFAWLALTTPHMLLLDEPTNHLETIDALAEAINEFDGGVVLVSHDFRLIDQVAKEIWIVEDGGCEEWQGDIHE
ncbi:ATP-dependent transporter, partial [Hyaloraphidium curvatum]